MPMSQFETPILRNTAPNVADSAATRMSHARLMAKPPPTHGPFTAAIHGLRDRWMRSLRVAMWSWPMNPRTVGLVPSAPGGELSAPWRSRPAQNPRPAPVRITHRSARSRSTAATTAVSSSMRRGVIALSRSGRSRVTSAMPSSTSSTVMAVRSGSESVQVIGRCLAGRSEWAGLRSVDGRCPRTRRSRLGRCARVPPRHHQRSLQLGAGRRLAGGPLPMRQRRPCRPRRVAPDGRLRRLQSGRGGRTVHRRPRTRPARRRGSLVRRLRRHPARHHGAGGRRGQRRSGARHGRLRPAGRPVRGPSAR